MFVCAVNFCARCNPDTQTFKHVLNVFLTPLQSQACQGLDIDPSEYVREMLHPGIMQVCVCVFDVYGCAVA
jgi:hypothetical protein